MAQLCGNIYMTDRKVLDCLYLMVERYEWEFLTFILLHLWNTVGYLMRAKILFENNQDSLFNMDHFIYIYVI